MLIIKLDFHSIDKRLQWESMEWCLVIIIPPNIFHGVFLKGLSL